MTLFCQLIQFVRSPVSPSGIALMRSPKVPETAENTSCSSRKGTLPTRRMGVRASPIQSSSFLYRFGPGSGKVQHFQLLRWSQDRSLPDFRAHPRAGTGSAELRHSGLCLRSEEPTSELQSLMRISYAVFCLKKKSAQHSIVRYKYYSYCYQYNY